MQHAAKFWFRHRAHAAWLVGMIGAATAIATAAVAVAHAALWRPLPVGAPNELVRVRALSRDKGGRISPGEFAAWTERQDAFTALASFEFDSDVFLNRTDRVEHFDAIRVTTNIFDVLAVRPVVGRTFAPEDAVQGAPPVAVLGERVWRRVFNSDRALVGRSVAFSTIYSVQAAVIIGVLPEGLDVQTSRGDGIDLYRPIADGGAAEGGGAGSRLVIARLHAGVNLDTAQSRLSAVAMSVVRDLELTRTGLTGVQLVPLHEELYGENRPIVTLLVIAACFVLLVAWANSAGVVLALTAQRSRERAIRVALGASAFRLARAALAEAAVIGAASAAVAWMLSRWLVVALIELAPPDVRRVNTAGIGWFESLCGAGLAISCALVLGVAPAAIHHGRDLGRSLRISGGMTMARSMLRIRRLLLAGQMAVVLALLTVAGLTVGTLWKLTHQPLGFSTDGVLEAEFYLPRRYWSEADRVRTLLDDLRRSALESSGMRTVAVAFDLPLTKRYGWIGASVPGGQRLTINNRVTEGFFDVLGIAFLAGRDYAPSDYVSGGVIIVNESFARSYLGGWNSAVGQIVNIAGRNPAHRVIGVVANVREQNLDMALEPTIYMPLAGMTPSRLVLLTKESGPMGLAEANLRAAFRRVDPDLYVNITPVADRFRTQTAEARLQATLLVGLGAFTLLLAGLGVYALVAQLAGDRSKELSIRSALGASSRSLVRLLMGTVLSSAMGGLASGLVLSWFAVRLVQRFLFNTSAFDPMTWIVAVSTLIGAAVVASWLPARRAAAADPAQALRDS